MRKLQEVNRKQQQQPNSGTTDVNQQQQQPYQLSHQQPPAVGNSRGGGVALLCSGFNGRTHAVDDDGEENVRLPTLGRYGRSQTDVTGDRAQRPQQYQLRREQTDKGVPIVADSTNGRNNGGGSDVFFRTSVPIVVDVRVKSSGEPLDTGRASQNGNGAMTSQAPDESSDEMLTGLEQRIESWHKKICSDPTYVRASGSQGQSKPLIIQLKRISLQV